VGRLIVTVGVFAVLALVVDFDQVVGRLGSLHPMWVLAALAVTVPQVALSAWRWRFTARELGVDLPLGSAVAEYYLATLLNQVLPGGVAGDVSRAWRHARVSSTEDVAGAKRHVVHAVLLERGSGQLVMMAIALGSVAALASGLDAAARMAVFVGAAGAALAAVVAFVRTVVRREVEVVGGKAARVGGAGFAASVDRALLAPGILAVQLTTSVLVIASYLAVYLLGARALGVSTPVTTLLPLIAPILVTMLLPVSVAGWGVREAAAAALWSAVGLTAVEGVSISVTYGLLVLVSSLPGALVPALGRRPRRSPDGTDGKTDAAPGPGFRSPGA
jgi:uncharacterized membrane protein YbhN (UPF0104 family)